MKEPEQRSRVLLAGSLPSLSQPLLMAIPIRLHAQDERERQQLRRGVGERGEVAKIDPSLRCEEKSKA